VANHIQIIVYVNDLPHETPQPEVAWRNHKGRL
jgi:hypothetical protein